jgi:serine/threonine protein phosphatase PrpC
MVFFVNKGICGHFVSNFVKTFLTSFFTKVETYEVVEETNIDLGLIYEKLKKNNYELIKVAFKMCNEELKKNTYDCSFSGTTCVIIFLIDNRLICANVGDSRAILYNEDIISLSNDHKPNLSEEKERIEKMGGVVGKLYDSSCAEDYYPYRVWVKNQKYPGLAMSRSIGDSVAQSIGVISDPGMIY